MYQIMTGEKDMLNRSVTKDMQSSLKLTQNIDVAGRYGATKSINSKNLTREQVDKNCENA